MADRRNYPTSYAGYEEDKKTSWFSAIYLYIQKTVHLPQFKGQGCRVLS